MSTDKTSGGINVSAWSIKNPIPALMLFVLLTLAGFMTFSKMKVQNFPDLDVPTISVSVMLPGASPEQLETEVAKKIENSIASIQGLKHTYTTVQSGAAIITAEFLLEKDSQEALDEVRSSISRVRSELPSDIKDPIVNKLNIAGSPVLAYAIKVDGMDPEALSWFVDNSVIKPLLSVKGVGSVSRVGGVNREVQVALDPLKLQSLGVSVSEVSRSLKQIQIDIPAGRGDLNGQEQTVRALGAVKDVNELAELSVILNNGRQFRLDQLATIKDTIAEPRSIALLNGESVVGFEISRSKGGSEIEVRHNVNLALEELKRANPKVSFTPVFDFVQQIDDNYEGSLHILYEGAVLAVIVVWLFLRDWRTTFISAVALPLSVIPTFIGMWYLGFSINVVTLLALSLVVGILVDDAIVEVENIMRHLNMGKTPYQAAMEASDEIGLAVVATTFTLVAVFLPTAFMSGIPGKFFKQFGWTAALAVLASLLVARVLTPMMAAYLLKPVSLNDKNKQQHDTHHTHDGVVMKTYMGLARWCLKHRFLTLFSAAAFFAFSIFLIQFLPTGFIPAEDSSQTQIKLELPPGTPLIETLKTAETARNLIKNTQYVKDIYTTIGAGSTGNNAFEPGSISDVSKATLTIVLTPRQNRPVRKQVVESQLRDLIAQVPGVRTTVGLNTSGSKYDLVLSGEDPNDLAATGLALEKELRTIPNIGSITSSASLVRPELVLKPDFQKAANFGVSTVAIGDTLRVATSGDYDVALPKLNLAQRQVPIMVRLDSEARQNIDVLSRLTVPSTKPNMPPVLLANLVDMSMESSSAQINRYDRSRNLKFSIELSGAQLGDVKKAIAELPTFKNLPSTVKQREIGDAEAQSELFASFGLAMLTGVLCIYIVLVLLFKDFLQPLTILVALPLSLGGAFVALLITGKSFSMPSLIGLIMLMGIATKNSILLVEYAIMAQRDYGLSRLDAILDACHKRAMPIVMTTLAMGAGMLPIAMSLGKADGSFKSPMAIAVIGGLITSTFLSLLVIPVVFDCVDAIPKALKRLLQRVKVIK